jgi:tRNA (guanine-N7-)-methyltransferase
MEGYEGYQLRIRSRVECLKSELMGSIPLDWERYALDIGCGHGDFLAAYGSQCLQTFGVGIDVLHRRLKQCRRKCRDLGNVQFFLADASEFFDACPEILIFDDVFVLYPDPWPKRRHASRRLLQPPFLLRLDRHLQPGSRVFFRTDASAYFDEAYAHMTTCRRWISVPETSWPVDTTTYFERQMCVERQKRPYSCVFEVH